MLDGSGFKQFRAACRPKHRDALPMAREDPDGLDISGRVASGTVPVTLRLTGAQRQLLDEVAAHYFTTRSAIVVAALAAAAPQDL